MKALIVEDHPETAELLAETIRLGDIEPEICRSAEEAMDLLSVRGVSAFDFYLLDLQLPGANGITLCEWIRKEPGGSDPHITVATGADHAGILADAFEAGADDYVEKPFSPKILALRLAVARETRKIRRARHGMNRELDRERDFFATLFDTAAACILALDRHGRIIEVNQAAIDMMGRETSGLKGRSFGWAATAGDGKQAETISAKLKGFLRGNDEICQFESLIFTPGRNSRHLNWLCRRIEEPSAFGNMHGSAALIVCVGTDITERRKKEARLTFLARHDPLTKLYNRSQLEPAVRRAIQGSRNGSHLPALMSIDLDHFKAVNDTAGHAAGDEVLRLVAQTLSEITRPTDTVIRLGGDEFVLILPDSLENQIPAVAERIRSEIEALRFEFSGRIFRITASIGVTLLTAATSVSEALARAEPSLLRQQAYRAQPDSHRPGNVPEFAWLPSPLPRRITPRARLPLARIRGAGAGKLRNWKPRSPWKS